MTLTRSLCLAALWVISTLCNAVQPMISAGGGGSLFLNADGSVWGTGNSGSTSPIRVLQLSNIVSIGAYGGTNVALLSDGTVWGSGVNNYGQLGDGTTQYRSQPQPVPLLSGVNAIAVNDHVLALKQDGTVWAWGWNNMGQLGDGSVTDRHTPVQVVGLKDIIAISVGHISSLAVKSDGTVWIWGQTCCGAAGNGSAAGSPGDPEFTRTIPTQVQNLDQVIAVASAGSNPMALRADGTVWTWGVNDMGQNGLGTIGSGSKFPQRIPGFDHVIAIVNDSSGSPMALKSDGTVWGWGNNNFGQLGVSNITYSTSPVQIPGLSDVVAISGSMTHRLAMRGDGTVLAWGTNAYGQLGDNTLQDRGQPQSVVGPGGGGQLNLKQPAPASFNQLPNAQISLSVTSGQAPLTVQATATGASDPDGTVSAFYWKTSAGQEATGSSASLTFATAGTYDIDLLVEDNSGGRGHFATSIVVTPATSGAISVNPKIRIGFEVAAALANDGRVLTWGSAPRLGLYNFQALQLPDANSHPMANGVSGSVDITLGTGSTVHALLSNGDVLGWGGNDHGQLGTGSTAEHSVQPQWLSALPPAQALAAGYTHVLALTRDGRVFAWGSNDKGQLGLGDNENRFLPVEVAGLSNVTAVAAGSAFSVALKADGTVWAWGDNSTWALGDGTTVSRNRPIQVPGLADIAKIFTSGVGIFAQKADGTVWISGGTPFHAQSNYGAASLNLGAQHLPVLDGAVQIAGSRTHVVVLKADGTVMSGGNSQNLGLGFIPGSDYKNAFQQIPGISDAIQVDVSEFNSIVLRRDGTVLAWGLNTSGQVGDGTLALRQTPALVINGDVNGFLDLIPEVPNTIPPDMIPPFLLATYSTGGLSSTTLYADLRGINSGGSFSSGDSGRFAAGYNVYVAANAPVLGASAFFQLNPNSSWSALNWPMSAFMNNVALDSQTSQVRAQILQNADLSSPVFAGAAILVGYGTDPDEMLSNGRYRTIFTVPQP